ncbi:MAG: bacterial/archaeal transporter family-2 protein [Solirubrobacteraceae bacterium]|jgi:transporter family-2 protein|nr:bacterial/archaeal transporter family-2 protein [Solirubrobacteraceae bacterium]
MDRGVALGLTVVLGALLAAQAPLNSQLARAVGGVQASVVAVGVSFAMLLALGVVAGPGLGGVRRIGEVPWHVIVGGGVVGGLYVGSVVFTVRALGVGGLTAATITGQLALAVAIDHFGWFGVERSPISPTRLAGLALLALGTYLVVRE